MKWILFYNNLMANLTGPWGHRIERQYSSMENYLLKSKYNPENSHIDRLWNRDWCACGLLFSAFGNNILQGTKGSKPGWRGSGTVAQLLTEAWLTSCGALPLGCPFRVVLNWDKHARNCVLPSSGWPGGVQHKPNNRQLLATDGGFPWWGGSLQVRAIPDRNSAVSHQKPTHNYWSVLVLLVCVCVCV